MQTLLAIDQPLAPILDALEDNICVIDTTGSIVFVNAAWRSFARGHGIPRLHSSGIGASYLDVCQRSAEAGDPYAPLVADGLRGVLGGKLPRFELEYPCPSAEEERYFLMTATPVMVEGTIHGAVVAHQDVTQFRLELQDSATLLSYYRTLVEGHAPRTASLLGDRPLRERRPELFEALIASYRGLLPRFLESRVLRITPPRRELGHMAWQLGEASAGPRDVIDLHVESLDLMVIGSLSQRKNTIIIEGRLMALELMGYLVDYYRNPARQRMAEEGRV